MSILVNGAESDRLPCKGIAPNGDSVCGDNQGITITPLLDTIWPYRNLPWLLRPLMAYAFYYA